MPAVSWSPQVARQAMNVTTPAVEPSLAPQPASASSHEQKHSRHHCANPPPFSGSNLTELSAAPVPAPLADLRRETFIMDDPSFVSSTPAATKMGHLLPADVSVIRNDGINVNDLRRPSSKELFGTAATATSQAPKEQFQLLRRETYVAQQPAQAPAPMEIKLQLTETELGDILNFSYGTCGSALGKDSEPEVTSVTEDVIAVSEKVVVEHEEEHNASLLVKHYMENSEKELSSATGNTLTNSQKTNSTGEVTAIQTVVTSPNGGTFKIDEAKITEVVKQNDENVSLMVKNLLENSEDSCAKGENVSDMRISLHTPEVEFEAGQDLSNSGQTYFVGSPLKQEVLAPEDTKAMDIDSTKTYCMESPVRSHETNSNSGTTYYVGSPAPAPEDELPFPSELSQNASLLIKEIVDRSEKEKMSTSQETYTVEKETIKGDATSPEVRRSSFDGTVGNEVDVMSTIDENAEEEVEGAFVGLMKSQTAVVSGPEKSPVRANCGEPFGVPSIVNAELPAPNQMRETFVVPPLASDKYEHLSQKGHAPGESDASADVSPTLKADAETMIMSTKNEESRYSVKPTTELHPRRVRRDMKSATVKGYFLSGKECDSLAKAQVSTIKKGIDGTRGSNAQNAPSVRQAIPSFSESLFSASKDIPCSTPSAVIDKCKPPKSRSGVVEKYNGSAAPSATLTFTKSKKTATSDTRKSMGGTGLLKKNAKVKRTSVGPQQRLTLIKPVRGSSMAGKVASHPNPFASRNIYYDERWVQKQESGFVKWLNFILTPDTMDGDEQHNLAPGKIDVAKLWRACSSNVRVPRAPTREVLSMRAYTARREMNRLRRHACTLWQTPSVAQVITRVEIEIEKKGLMIRKDRSLNKDVGMKKGFLELLLSYNMLWLKMGLETVYGEVLSFARGVDDIIGISQFIVTRMLSNPDILSQFAHPTVPHHYSPGCEEALKQFTLKKFLQLVYFLDRAKLHRIIKHNPCLFHKDSKAKHSKDLVITFSRDFLAGEGDVVKHLNFLGYNLTHKQTVLDEYDYAVTNLAIDLKDGVRLCRVMEFLTASQCLSDKLRMPAGSRLQKLHNVDTALSALRSSEAGLPPSITAKDIVDGHLEKTLALMWHVIFGFQLDRILDEDRLQSETDHLRKSLRYRAQIKDREALAGSHFILECNQRELAEESSAAQAAEAAAPNRNRVLGAEDDWANSRKMRLLLKWARLVCAHYGVEVSNSRITQG